MLSPIRRSIVVPATAERAFSVFTSGMTSWWPKTHHIGEAPIAEIIIEPLEGGRWYTRYDPSLVTTVEVTFTAVEGGTRVAIEHRDLDRYGPEAERMHQVFSGPSAWGGMLDAYAGSI